MIEMNVEVEPGTVGFDAARLARIESHFAHYLDDRRLPGWLILVNRFHYANPVDALYRTARFEWGLLDRMETWPPVARPGRRLGRVRNRERPYPLYIAD